MLFFLLHDTLSWQNKRKQTKTSFFIPSYYRYDPNKRILNDDFYQISSPKQEESTFNFYELFQQSTKENEINLTSLKFLSDQNFSKASHFLGDLFLYGSQNIAQNLTKAIEYYKKGAINGFPDSYQMLSFIYRYGIGMKKPNPLISSLYETIAADKNSVNAMLSKSYSHAFRRNIPFSNNKASRYLLKIAESLCKMNEMENQHKTFRAEKIDPNDFSKNFYSRMKKIKYDEYKYNIIKEKALRSQNVNDLINLGEVKYCGLYGSDIDYVYAREIFESHKDNGISLYYLAQMYHYGHGVNKSIEKAKKYYKRSIKKGEFRSYTKLGLIKIDEKDYDAAAFYFIKASNLGNIYAQYNFAKLLLDGTRKIKKNPNDSYFILNVIKEKLLLAKYAVSLLLLDGRCSKYNEKKAITMLLEIIQDGPWIKNAILAEDLFLSREYNRALIIWMQLADIGIEAAAFNAGYMLLNYKFFFGKTNPNVLNLTENQIIYIAEEMFKISYNLGNNDASVYLAKVYKLKHEYDKCFKILSNEFSKNDLAKIELGKEVLKGEIAPTNYTRAYLLVRKINWYYPIFLLPCIYKTIFIDLFSNLLKQNYSQLLVWLKDFYHFQKQIISVSTILEINILIVMISISRYFISVAILNNENNQKQKTD